MNLRRIVARLVLGVTLAGVAAGVVVVPASAAHAATDADLAAALELAERYAPIIAVQRQVDECGPGEPYLPTDALALIGHPDVLLRDADGAVVTSAPSAADLAAAPDEWHLDFPGDALRPGCDYEQWFRANGDEQASVYARIVIDPDHPQRLVIQYWSFWIYNDWNNLHEGDWEMVQVVFEAATVAEALEATPVEMVVAQHEGGQRGPWDAVERDGTRPVLYPAGGSHATFFESGLWLGKRADSGFGCDDSRGPSDRLDPTVILIPETIDPDGEHAWLGWRGRWGEQQPLFNNGPEGPIAKTQWSHPVTWMEDTARTSSLSVPPVAGDVTELFCSATERGSLAFIRFIANPLLVAGVLALAVALLVMVARRTAWSPVIARPVAQRRSSGQVLRSAWSLVWLERRAFAPTAAIVVVGGLAASVVRLLLDRVAAVDDLELLFAGDSVAGILLSFAVGSLVSIPIVVAALTVGVIAADRLDARVEERAVTRPLVIASTLLVLAIAVGPLWLPVGIVLLARWGVAPLLGARGSSAVVALRGSAALTRGRRVQTAATLALAVAIVGVTGPFIGGLMLIVSAAPFAFVNLIAGVITAALIPWLAVVIAMVHGDLATRDLTEGGP